MPLNKKEAGEPHPVFYVLCEKYNEIVLRPTVLSETKKQIFGVNDLFAPPPKKYPSDAPMDTIDVKSSRGVFAGLAVVAVDTTLQKSTAKTTPRRFFSGEIFIFYFRPSANGGDYCNRNQHLKLPLRGLKGEN